MSYCRWSTVNCDLYIIHHVGMGNGSFLRCYCSETPEHKTKTKNATPLRSEMIEHIKEHQANGDRVPGWLIPNFEQEIKDYGDDVTVDDDEDDE